MQLIMINLYARSIISIASSSELTRSNPHHHHHHDTHSARSDRAACWRRVAPRWTRCTGKLPFGSGPRSTGSANYRYGYQLVAWNKRKKEWLELIKFSKMNCWPRRRSSCLGGRMLRGKLVHKLPALEYGGDEVARERDGKWRELERGERKKPNHSE